MSQMEDETRASFLDFSRTNIRTVHQLHSALSKVTDLRLRSERLREEDVVPSYSLLKKKGNRVTTQPFPYLDPVPPSMRQIDIQELCQVDIDWRMLTLSRPSCKFEEEVFSRLVELAKLTAKARQSYRPPIQRSSLLPMRLGGRTRSTDDSGEENNSDNIQEFCYDFFVRQSVAEDDDIREEEEQSLDTNAEIGVKRRTVKKGTVVSKKPETQKNTNRLTLPSEAKSRSRSSTPEMKVKGRESRSEGKNKIKETGKKKYPKTKSISKDRKGKKK